MPKLSDLYPCHFLRWTRPAYVSPSIPEQAHKSWPAPWEQAEGIFIYDGRSYPVYLPFANAPSWAIAQWGGPWPATGTGLHDLTLEGSVGSSATPAPDPRAVRHWRITDGYLIHIGG